MRRLVSDCLPLGVCGGPSEPLSEDGSTPAAWFAPLDRRRSVSRAGSKSSDEDPWPNVLEQASKAVVMLKIHTVRFFESAETAISVSSGFVVDKNRGILLTNRHVVQAGPIVGKAVFLNNEEVSVKPIYRDPEHDFGFLQFDPSKIEHMEIQELRLYPEGAKLGVSYWSMT